METIFDKFDKYPYWVKDLSAFCQNWHFDNITQVYNNKKLDKIQNNILMKFVRQLVDCEIKDLTYDIDSVKDFVKLVNEQFIEHYPREKKDSIWKTILIDEYCSNKSGFQSTIE